MRVRNLISVGAMMMIIVASVAYLISVGLPVTDRIGVRQASMQLANSNGLVVGSRVLYRGVAIGKVTSVAATLKGVTVDWNYQDGYTIPADSQFRVDSLSALGETYIGISPPEAGGPGLPDNAVLTSQNVLTPTTFDQLSRKVVEVLQQMHSDKINTVVRATNESLISDQTVLQNLNRAGSLLQTTILSTRVPFTELLTQFQSLLIRGSDLSGSIAAAGDPIRAHGAALQNFLNWCVVFIKKDNLPTALTSGAGPFLENAQRFLDKAAPDLRVIATAATPFVTPALAQAKTVDLSQLFSTAMAVAGDGTGLNVALGAPPR